MTDLRANEIYKEWVESHPRTVRRANARPRISPFGDAANTSRKRIEINSNLLFLLVPGRGLEPPRSYPLVPETSASTNSATRAGKEGGEMYARVPGLSI
jgi:hypothetical protein